ncbi:hypothetical protein GCM10009864_03930 [Streptomyces lunalinharesii]|uniref:Uncharacterized protein n=1 Tax=Streptomyces lunalinharesii TaxID=333384 RepID=A0ABN3R7C9_9ACTN
MVAHLGHRVLELVRRDPAVAVRVEPRERGPGLLYVYRGWCPFVVPRPVVCRNRGVI